MTKEYVLKVQQPLFTTGDKANWLFYNDNGSIYGAWKPDTNTIKAMNDKPKVYAVYTRGKGKLIFSRLANKTDDPNF